MGEFPRGGDSAGVRKYVSADLCTVIVAALVIEVRVGISNDLQNVGHRRSNSSLRFAHSFLCLSRSFRGHVGVGKQLLGGRRHCDTWQT
jgi:hypothetical protein